MERPNFRELCPYILNAQILSTAKLKMLGEKQEVISERLLYEVLNEFDGNEEEVDRESMSLDFGILEIRYRGKEIRLAGDSHFLIILKLLIEVGKANEDFHNWNWFFVRTEYILEDPTDSQRAVFFIAKGDHILKDWVALGYDIPNDLLKERKEEFKYYWNDDQMDEMALVRICYEKFYKETKFGQYVMSSRKNERDLQLFGGITPCIDDLSLVGVIPKMNAIFKELRKMQWTIIIISCLIIAIIILKR